MSSRYSLRVTAAVPEAMISNGNHLAGCLGESMADMNTYKVPRYEDDAGNKYSLMSTASTTAILDKMGAGEVVRPSFDKHEQIDLEAAQAAMDETAVFYPMTANEDPESPMAAPDWKAKPDRITAMVGFEPDVAIKAMGLFLIPVEEDQ